MVNFLAIWGPVLLLIIAAGLVAWKQISGYGKHVDRVSEINAEISDLARKNHAIAEEQLAVLRQIKALLEDRKS
jgi:hypothetical protein